MTFCYATMATESGRVRCTIECGHDGKHDDGHGHQWEGSAEPRGIIKDLVRLLVIAVVVGIVDQVHIDQACVYAREQNG